MPPREDGFALPAEVRRVRAWWLRYARGHIRDARTDVQYRKWHLQMAADGRRYARGVVEHWLANRKA